MNCEFIDIEAQLFNESEIQSIIKKKRCSKIISSFHDYKIKVTNENISQIYKS